MLITKSILKRRFMDYKYRERLIRFLFKKSHSVFFE